MKSTISVRDSSNNYYFTILIDKISHLSKSEDGYTLVHLITGITLKTEDSMKTVEARINSPE